MQTLRNTIFLTLTFMGLIFANSLRSSGIMNLPSESKITDLNSENIEVVKYILGSEILTVFNEEVESGFYSFDVNLSNIVEGIYFVSILSEGKVMETTKMIIQ